MNGKRAVSRFVGLAVSRHVHDIALCVSFLTSLTAYPTHRLLAQSSQPAPTLYRTGKWVAAAAAVALTGIGIADHDQANAAYSQLVTYCAAGTCQLGPDGHYTDPYAESKYHTVVEADRAARVFLVSGQVALAGAVAMFILELHHAGKEPPNIPYHGLTIAPARIAGASVVRIGWRLGTP